MNDLTLSRTINRTLDRLTRGTIGYDPLLQMFEDTQAIFDSQGYPPYNIEKTGEDSYRITLALAGFRRDDIDLTVHDGLLTVSGTQAEENDDQGGNYLYRGIATRQFRRQYRLADYVEVTAADLHDGLLRIDLERRVPEEKRARKIPIRNGVDAPLVDASE